MEAYKEIYKEYETKKQDSHFNKILKLLRDAGCEGITNGELTKVNHRFSSTIYELRLYGFNISIRNKGNGLIVYTLMNHIPAKTAKAKKGIDIVGDEIGERFGSISIWELMEILEENSLHITHKPNGLNKSIRRTI